MAVSFPSRPLQGSSVGFAVLLGASVGAMVGGLSIIIGIGEPRDVVVDAEGMYGLAVFAGVFGAAIGAIAGLLVGLALWKLDHLLITKFGYLARSTIECCLVTSATGLASAAAFTGLAGGTVALMGTVGAGLALVVSAGYFTLRCLSVPVSER
ncbi:hypothetical protein [Arthrobacter sp. H20]|uniref:hypothetical protein n=1 Tax=Arthrobacter sp. H20 TaxID=1267981 RepID=UPI00047D6FE4|nr:hypothetical protein [Arthrobacter sp. H20]